MSDKTAKTRIVVNLTKPYVEALDHFVDEGIYLERQVIIRAALRCFFESRGVEAFCPKTVGTQGEAGVK